MMPYAMLMPGVEELLNIRESEDTYGFERGRYPINRTMMMTVIIIMYDHHNKVRELLNVLSVVGLASIMVFR